MREIATYYCNLDIEEYTVALSNATKRCEGRDEARWLIVITQQTLLDQFLRKKTNTLPYAYIKEEIYLINMGYINLKTLLRAASVLLIAKRRFDEGTGGRVNLNKTSSFPIQHPSFRTGYLNWFPGPGKDFGTANAQNLNREARQNCNAGLKRPLETHTNMNSGVTKRFRNPDDSEKVTERGRFAEEGAPYYREPWLLCSSPEHMIVAFMSSQDTSVVFDSTHLIMDGTFKISPDGFTQLYILHAWGAFEFEAIPV
uniref:Uncharacterized protein n=1 Tax=Romanomermis culicivorax TaxID=13658 RepID=A0A915HX33_ROMCU